MEQSGQIGSQGAWDVKFEGMVAHGSISYQQGPAKVAVQVELAAKDIALKSLEWLKQVIPGTFDDKIIEIVEAGLAKL